MLIQFARPTKSIGELKMNHYRLFEITPEGESFETGHAVTTDNIDSEDLLPLLKGMKLLPKKYSPQRLSADFDKGTWTISIKDVPGERKGFMPVFMLVGPWNELGA
jgi:hypothetical protein